MASLVQMEEFRRANERVAELARRDLEAFFGTLDLTRPELARDTLLEFVPVLIAQYGDLAASVAAEWFDELRAEAKVRGRFRAVGAAAVPAAQAEASVRWAASHLFTEAPSGMLAPLSGAVVKMVLEPSRNTVIDMTARDPRGVGWQRNARPTACDFCLMLMGRGGVYRSERTASFASHGACHCTASPSWDARAPEVPTRCYEASERMQKVRNRAADPSDPKKQAKAQRVLDNHRSNVNSYLKDMKPELDAYRAELTQALAA